jgi:hypothetical protein
VAFVRAKLIRLRSIKPASKLVGVKLRHFVSPFANLAYVAQTKRPETIKLIRICKNAALEISVPRKLKSARRIEI